MVPRYLLIGLAAAALLLPALTVLLYLLGKLLGAMQDSAGQDALLRVSQGSGVLWLVGLVALLLALGVDSAGRGSTGPK